MSGHLTIDHGPGHLLLAVDPRAIRVRVQRLGQVRLVAVERLVGLAVLVAVLLGIAAWASLRRRRKTSIEPVDNRFATAVGATQIETVDGRFATAVGATQTETVNGRSATTVEATQIETVNGRSATTVEARSIEAIDSRSATTVEATQIGQPLDSHRVDLANRAAAQRLWVLAFASPSQSQAWEVADRRVRDNVMAVLQVDTLDQKYFPRRPALMPQLMQAVNDPLAAAEKLARIVAHDPVLTSDVLRLANSSLLRVAPGPIETIQRAIVVCGVDALRGMLAAAMLRPVFRATSKNFPRLPRMLWERTERAARAAELYILTTHPADRFEAQLVVLLSALGPLVVYSAALDVYSRNPHFSPSAALCVELIGELAPQTSRHIARDWQTSPRLLAALEQSPAEPLYVARQVGELFGTLSLLESQNVILRDERLELLSAAGVPAELSSRLWAGFTGAA